MEEFQKYLDPVTLAKVEGLDLQARLAVEGYIAGLHKSPYQGFSVEFAEHREYSPGDDIRHVDWKVWSRTDKLYLKQYEEETNLISYVVLDSSESMRYGSASISKFEYARWITATLSYLVLRQHDSIGLATYNSQMEEFVRPSSQPSHLKQILNTIDSAVPTSGTDSGTVFHDLAERFVKRGLVIIVSDFFDDVDQLMSGLRHFKHRRHDVLLFQVLDRAELELPFQDSVLFKGLEGMAEILSEPRFLRRAYQEEFNGFLTALESGCRGYNIDYVRLCTDQRLDVALSSYLSARSSRRK